MKLTLRIWFTALIIQPVLFCFVLLWAAIFIVPYEIAGSIPGILLFGLVLHLLRLAKLPVTAKWILLIAAGLGLAFLCSYMILAAVKSSEHNLLPEDYQFLIPAPIAALLSLLIHRNSIHEHLLCP